MIDFMVLETMSASCLGSWAGAQAIITGEASSVFEIEVGFDDQGEVVYKPTLEQLQASVAGVLTGSVKALNGLPRLLTQPSMRPFLRDSGLPTQRVIDCGPTFFQILSCSRVPDSVREGIASSLRQSYEDALTLKKGFAEYSPIHLLGLHWDPRRYVLRRGGGEFKGVIDFVLESGITEETFLLRPDDQPIVDFALVSADIDQFREYVRSVAELRQGAVKGALHVDSRLLKAELTPIPATALADLEELLGRLLSGKIDALTAAFKYYARKLKTEPKTLDECVEFCDVCRRTGAVSPQIEIEMAFVERMFELFRDCDFRHHHQELNLDDTFRRFTADRAGALVMRDQQLPTFVDVLKVAIFDLCGKLEKLRARARALPPSIHECDIDSRLPAARTLVEKVEAFADDVANLRRQQATMEVTLNPLTVYGEVLGEAQFAVQVYETLGRYGKVSILLEKTPFAVVRVNELRDQILALKEEADGLRDCAPVAELRLSLAETIPYLERLQTLAGGRLAVRHWNLLFEGSQSQYRPEITIAELVECGVLKNSRLEEIVQMAQGEFGVEGEFGTLADQWKATILPFDTDSWVLGDTATIERDVQDGLSALQQISQGPYVGQIREQLASFTTTLENVGQVLVEWRLFQGNWGVLGGLFDVEESQRVMPGQYSRFSGVERKWTAICHHVQRDPHVFVACGYPGLLMQLREMNRVLESILTSLGKLLDAKRAAVPRLCFLSNEGVLTFSTTTDVRQLKRVIPRLFMNVIGVDFHGEDAESVGGVNPRVYGLIGELDTLSFAKPVASSRDGIETWIGGVIDQMRTSLVSAIVGAAATFPTEPSAIWEWASPLPLHAAYVALHAVFTADCDSAIALPDWTKAGVEAKYKQRIEGLSETFLTPMPARDREKSGVLIALLLQLRDLSRLLSDRSREGVPAVDVGLLPHVRVAQDTGKIWVSCGEARAEFDGEFWGRVPCMFGCLGARKSALFGILRYEQVFLSGSMSEDLALDLGALLGRYTFVLRPYPGLAPPTLSRIIQGAGAVGALLVVRDAEKLRAEFACTLWDAARSLVGGASAGVGRAMVHGRSLDVGRGVSVLWSGECGKLPDHVRASLRPVALDVPTPTRYAESFLQAAGFRAFRQISVRIASVAAGMSQLTGKDEQVDPVLERALQLRSAGIDEELAAASAAVLCYGPSLREDVLTASFEGTGSLATEARTTARGVVPQPARALLEREVSELHLDLDVPAMTERAACLLGLIGWQSIVTVAGGPASGKSLLMEVLRRASTRSDWPMGKLDFIRFYPDSDSTRAIFGEEVEDPQNGPAFLFGSLHATIRRVRRLEADRKVLVLDGNSAVLRAFIEQMRCRKGVFALNSLDLVSGFSVVVETNADAGADLVLQPLVAPLVPLARAEALLDVRVASIRDTWPAQVARAIRAEPAMERGNILLDAAILALLTRDPVASLARAGEAVIRDQERFASELDFPQSEWPEYAPPDYVREFPKPSPFCAAGEAVEAVAPTDHHLSYPQIHPALALVEQLVRVRRPVLVRGQGWPLANFARVLSRSGRMKDLALCHLVVGPTTGAGDLLQWLTSHTPLTRGAGQRECLIVVSGRPGEEACEALRALICERRFVNTSPNDPHVYEPVKVARAAIVLCFDEAIALCPRLTGVCAWVRVPALTDCAAGYIFGKLLTASGVAEADVERVYAASSAGTPEQVVRAGRFACYVTDKSNVATLESVVRAEIEFIRGTAGSEVLYVGFEPGAVATAKQVQQLADELRYFLGIYNQGIERVWLNFSPSVVRSFARLRHALSSPGRHVSLSGPGKYALARLTASMLENDFVNVAEPTSDELAAPHERRTRLETVLREVVTSALQTQKKAVVFARYSAVTAAECAWLVGVICHRDAAALFGRTGLDELYAKQGTTPGASWDQKVLALKHLRAAIAMCLHLVIADAPDWPELLPLVFEGGDAKLELAQFELGREGVAPICSGDTLGCAGVLKTIGADADPVAFAVFVETVCREGGLDYKEMTVRAENIRSALGLLDDLQAASQEVERHLDKLTPGLQLAATEFQQLMASSGAKKDAIEMRRQKIAEDKREKELELERLSGKVRDADRVAKESVPRMERMKRDFDKLKEADVEAVRIAAQNPPKSLKALMEILCVVCDTEPSYEKCGLPMLLQSGFLAKIGRAVASHPVSEKYVTELLGRLDSPSFERAELEAVAPCLRTITDWLEAVVREGHAGIALKAETKALEAAKEAFAEWTEASELELSALVGMEKQYEADLHLVDEARAAREDIERACQEAQRRKSRVDAVLKEMDVLVARWNSYLERTAGDVFVGATLFGALSALFAWEEPKQRLEKLELAATALRQLERQAPEAPLEYLSERMMVAHPEDFQGLDTGLEFEIALARSTLRTPLVLDPDGVFQHLVLQADRPRTTLVSCASGGLDGIVAGAMSDGRTVVVTDVIEFSAMLGEILPLALAQGTGEVRVSGRLVTLDRRFRLILVSPLANASDVDPRWARRVAMINARPAGLKSASRMLKYAFVEALNGEVARTLTDRAREATMTRVSRGVLEDSVLEHLADIAATIKRTPAYDVLDDEQAVEELVRVRGQLLEAIRADVAWSADDFDAAAKPFKPIVKLVTSGIFELPRVLPCSGWLFPGIERLVSGVVTAAHSHEVPALRQAAVTAVFGSICASAPMQAALSWLFLTACRNRKLSEADLKRLVDHVREEYNATSELSMPVSAPAGTDAIERLKFASLPSVFALVMRVISETFGADFVQSLPTFNAESLLAGAGQQPALVLSSHEANPAALLVQKCRQELLEVVSFAADASLELVKNARRALQTAIGRGTTVMVCLEAGSPAVTSMLLDILGQNAHAKVVLLVPNDRRILPVSLQAKCRKIASDGFPALKGAGGLLSHFSAGIRSTTNARGIKRVAWAAAVAHQLALTRGLLAPVPLVPGGLGSSTWLFRDALEALQATIDQLARDLPTATVRTQVLATMYSGLTGAARRRVDAEISRLEATLLDDDFSLVRGDSAWRPPGDVQVQAVIAGAGQLPVFAPAELLRLHPGVREWSLSRWVAAPLLPLFAVEQAPPVQELASLLPEDLPLPEPAAIMTAVDRVIVSEVEALNGLLAVMRAELPTLTSEETPRKWSQLALLGGRSVSSFVGTIVERHAQLERCLAEPLQRVYDARLLRDPRELIKAFLLDFATSSSVPSAQLQAEFKPGDPLANLEDGAMYLTRAALFGAAWESGGIVPLRERAAPLRRIPALSVKPIGRRPAMRQVEVPLYRGALEPDPTEENLVWTIVAPSSLSQADVDLAGVCVICNPPDCLLS